MLTTALTAAVLAAGCGGGGPSAARPSKAYQRSLVFTQCMRSHGALAFPDPSSQGTFDTGQFNANVPPVSTALRACQRVLPPGAFVVPEAQQRQVMDQALQLAMCMRAHGLPGFPDPVDHDGQVGFTMGPGIDPDSPLFRSAQQACRRFGPGGAG